MSACESKLVSRSSRKLTVARSPGHMPSLVGDRGQVLRVLGWALTRICNLLLVLHWAIPFNKGTPLWMIFQCLSPGGIDMLGYLRILL